MQPDAQRREAPKPRRPVDTTAERTGIDCDIISSDGFALVIMTRGRSPRRVVLPLGQVSIDGCGQISMPEWLAADKGLV